MLGDLVTFLLPSFCNLVFETLIFLMKYAHKRVLKKKEGLQGLQQWQVNYPGALDSYPYSF